MTEILLSQLEHRPDRPEVVDQTPARLWHPNGARVVIAWRYGGLMARALIQHEAS